MSSQLENQTERAEALDALTAKLLAENETLRKQRNEFKDDLGAVLKQRDSHAAVADDLGEENQELRREWNEKQHEIDQWKKTAEQLKKYILFLIKEIETTQFARYQKQKEETSCPSTVWPWVILSLGAMLCLTALTALWMVTQ